MPASSDSSDSSNSSSDSEERKASRFQIDVVQEKGENNNSRRPSRGAEMIGVKFQRSKSIEAMPNLVPEPNLKSLVEGDRLPNAEHYRVSVDLGIGKRQTRPTIEELMAKVQMTVPRHKPSLTNDPEIQLGQGSEPLKLGWIKGVYVKCLLNIWGVMLFLRLSWLVGQAGLLEGLAIITLANSVTMITSLSMSAVSTNGTIKGGGIYYMLSRALGPEFGGAIGLMITMANAIAVAMYVIGFCESLLDMLGQYMTDFDGIVNDRLNDIRIIGTVVMISILCLAIVGMEWVSKVELGLLALLAIAQVDFIIGSFLPPTDEQKANGFVGYNKTVMFNNLWSDYQGNESAGEKYSFFQVFAVFFPAVTGIVAGANFSGDLKDPAMAIPQGTLAAIATTYVSYILYCIMIAGCCLRNSSGEINEVLFAKNVLNETFIEEYNITYSFDDCAERDCLKGSFNDQQLMQVVSAWGPLIYAGCFAATLSSAIASLVGAPRVFQAVAKDKLFPGITTFSDGYGPNNDPIKGYILIFFVSLACTLIGDLNDISTLLSNFFVASYALMNFAVFHASITNTPGWRPSFKYYNKWVSLFGTVLCIAVMFLMSLVTALVTFVIVFLLCVFIKVRKPDVNWGSSTQSQYFITALKSVQSLTKVEDHVKNYRPKLVVLSGDPSHRPSLIDFAYLITKDISLMTCINVVTDAKVNWKKKEEIKARGENWLHLNRIKAFYAVTSSTKLSEGTRAAIDFCGLGKLVPNMMLLGFHEEWHKDEDTAQDYFQTLIHAFKNHLSIGMLRIRGGLDLTDIAIGEEIEPYTPIQIPPRVKKITECSETEVYDLSTSKDSGLDDGFSNVELDPCPSSFSPDSDDDEDEEPKTVSKLEKVLSSMVWSKHRKPLFPGRRDSNTSVVSIQMAEKARCFRGKKGDEGTIDVYWLFDDGGLTLLLPYILSSRSIYKKSKLRIFFLSNKIENIDSETRNMAELMAKFRIDCNDIVAISDAISLPAKHTRDSFLAMIKADLGEKAIDDATLKRFSKRINFNLRIAEIVRTTSAGANLVVMTLPVPKKDHLPPSLYLSLLDYTTRNMPPFFLVRGNQQSVLTYYS